MPFDEETINEVYDKTNGYCEYCGKKVARTNYGQVGRHGSWEIDHSVPLSKGGTNYLQNLYPACIECNRDKGDMSGKSYRAKKAREGGQRRSSSSGCFIATAAFGSPHMREVNTLRHWRDKNLQRTVFGRFFIRVYYQISPPIATFMHKTGLLRASVRRLLRPLCRWVQER